MFAMGERFMASTRSDSVIEDGLSSPWGSALGENVGLMGVVIMDEDDDITEDAAERKEGYDLDEEEE